MYTKTQQKHTMNQNRTHLYYNIGFGIAFKYYRIGESKSIVRGTELLPNPSRETKFSGANGDRGNFFFPVQLTTSRIGNLTRLILILAVCDDYNTHRQTYSCCCCFSHSAYWLPTRKTLLYYTVANPARGLLNREKRTKQKVWQHTPPTHCSFGENK